MDIENPQDGGEPSQGSEHSTSSNKSSAETDTKQLLGGGIRITLFTAINPTRLSKRFSLKGDVLVKESGGVLIEGEAERLCLTGIAEFAQLLTDLTPNRALAYGVNGHDVAYVVPKANVAAAAKKIDQPVIARDREHMAWSEGPGILLGDYDPADGAESLSPDALLSILCEVCPDLAKAPHLTRPSAGSCIINMDTVEELRGVRGQRVYIHVEDASDLERAGKNIIDRLWLKGHGRIQISKSGGLLLRTLLDATVFQPERLDFAGGAECIAPLKQLLPKPRISNPDAAPLNTRTALPDLSPEQQQKVVRLQTAAKKACADQAAAVRKTWSEGRLIELVERCPDVSKKRLREVVKQAVEGCVLGPEFVLYTSDMQPVAVAELLADPERYHDTYLRDPLEPDYGSTTAWVNLEDEDNPFIFSHAHGLNAHYELCALARATIELKGGKQPKNVDACIAAIRADGSLYEHGDELVRLVDGGIETVTDFWLRVHLGRIVYFTKYNERKQGQVQTDCTQDLARLVLAQQGNWNLRKLRAVISAPIMRLDGSILQTKGYDPASGLYLDHQPDAPINLKPTLADVIAAIQRLWFPYKEFPFVDAVARGVHLAGNITAVQRPVLPTAPAIIYDAPVAGTGKTELAGCLAQLGGEEIPTMMPPVTQEDEMRKRLLSGLRAGKPVLVLDNQSGPLDSDSLCVFLTCPWYGDRVLSQSVILNFPNTALFLVTGNNIQLVGDLIRRSITARLDAQKERPDKRSFDLKPKAYVKDNRQAMVRDALTLLLGYQNLRPEGQRLGTGRMASFEPWDDMVRQAVIWASGLDTGIKFADPLDSIDTAHAQDPKRAKHAALLVGWDDLYGEEPKKIADVIAELRCASGGWKDGNKMYQVLHDIAGKGRDINPHFLGIWIGKNADRIIDGLRFERGGTLNGSATWFVRDLSRCE
ncbi:hypothetical protein [Pseudomonas serbica]|jgi:hypothetical protein